MVSVSRRRIVQYPIAVITSLYSRSSGGTTSGRISPLLLLAASTTSAFSLHGTLHHQRSTASMTSALSDAATSDPVADVTGYLGAQDAAALDVELMSSPGFSLEQLMELAGLAVAEAAYQVLTETTEQRQDRVGIVVVCGPGNNGGDGLVAARHLRHFGYQDVVVVYPKRNTNTHFVNLVTQCENVGVAVLDAMPENKNAINKRLVVIDAVFGFSFHGSPREPFASVLTTMMHLQQASAALVLSVDVPSGWHVDEGDVSHSGFVPDVLVSLTTPKGCSKYFTGRHFVGGRFLTDALAEKYHVRMPPYPGTSQVMEIQTLHQSTQQKNRKDTWAEEYQQYLNEKNIKSSSNTNNNVPVTEPEQENTNEDWTVGYANYCEEKERALTKKDVDEEGLTRQKSDTDGR